MQKVMFVEDDRETIPVVIVGEQFKGIQFAIMYFDQILAINSLQFDWSRQEDYFDGLEDDQKLNLNNIV